MAPKRSTPQEDLSSSHDEQEQHKITLEESSPASEEEEDESEEEEEDESEEEDEEETLETPPTVPPKSKQSATTVDAASDSAIKPSKKITAEKASTSKRKKKSADKRFWSNADQILILQRLLDYHSEKKCSPFANMKRFYKFTMELLPGEASQSQLYEKLRRLKKKFRVNNKSTREDPVFSEPHEQDLYELSKKIWGIHGCESVPAATVEVEDEEMIIGEDEDFETLYPNWTNGLNAEGSKLPVDVVLNCKEKFSLIGEDQGRKMDGKWNAVFEKEFALKQRRISLLGRANEKYKRRKL